MIYSFLFLNSLYIKLKKVIVLMMKLVLQCTRKLPESYSLKIVSINYAKLNYVNN